VTASDPSPTPERRAQSPLDRLLDLAVYGPVGLALAARELLPRWAETGRRQVEAQAATARAVGRLAVDQGARQAARAVRGLADRGGTVLREAGVAPAGRRPPPSDGAPMPDVGVPDVGPSGDRAPGAEAQDLTGAASPAGGPPPGPAVGAVDTEVPGPSEAGADLDAGLDPAELAIPGYDTLSASQVVQRLPGLSAEELEAVRTYELAGRARKTILLRVAQLKSAS
jgi:hypothetical protein